MSDRHGRKLRIPFEPLRLGQTRRRAGAHRLHVLGAVEPVDDPLGPFRELTRVDDVDRTVLLEDGGQGTGLAGGVEGVLGGDVVRVVEDVVSPHPASTSSSGIGKRSEMHEGTFIDEADAGHLPTQQDLLTQSDSLSGLAARPVDLREEALDRPDRVATRRP